QRPGKASRRKSRAELPLPTRGWDNVESHASGGASPTVLLTARGRPPHFARTDGAVSGPGNAEVEHVKTVRTIRDLRDEIALWRASGQSVALVPTMGALHAGHIALVAAALALADRTVVSIFVNPTQFAPHEDLARYPRDEAGD